MSGQEGNFVLCDDAGDPQASVVSALRQFPLFEGVPAEDLHAFARGAQRASFRQGRNIFDDQDSSDYVYFILEGSVAIQVESITPAYNITLAKVSAGETLGEFALAGFGSRSATARCLETVEAVRLEAAKLRERFEADTALGYKVMTNLARIVAERVLKMNRRMLNLYRSNLY